MEPQINYGGYQSGSSGTPKIYGRRGFAGKGCLGVIGLIVILVIIIVVGIIFAYPALTPNAIHGSFMDMTIVPQKDGSQKVWILTDGSFNFIQTSKSPGSYSTGRKCFFCKTWTYIYDPVNEKVIKKIKTPYEDIITTIKIHYHKGQVWVITSEYGKNDPRIEAYDAETGDLVMDTKAFMAKYPILSGGLSGLHFDAKENQMMLKTKDGHQGIVYSFATDKLYEDYAKMRDEIESMPGDASFLVLSPEKSGSGPRKRLYLVSGPMGKLMNSKSSLESYASNPESLKFFTGATSEAIGEKIYLEGLLYYQDDDCAAVIYLDELGKKSNRLLTLVDKKQKREMWTAGPDVLFKKMRIDENKDSFSSLFFTKDNIEVKRSGNVVLLELKGEGIMAFDYATGKLLWQLDI